jgi:Tetracyclin repressor-like, C-terminal domain
VPRRAVDVLGVHAGTHRSGRRGTRRYATSTADFSSERRAVLVDVLRDAVEAGDLPPDTDPEILADALVGPILLRRLMLAERVEAGIAPKIVGQLLPPSVD